MPRRPIIELFKNFFWLQERKVWTNNLVCAYYGMKKYLYSVKIDISIVLPSSLNLVNLYGISSAAGDGTQHFEYSRSRALFYILLLQVADKLLWVHFNFTIYTCLSLGEYVLLISFAFHASPPFYCQLLEFTYIDLWWLYVCSDFPITQTVCIFRLMMTTIFISSEEKHSKSTTILCNAIISFFSWHFIRPNKKVALADKLIVACRENMRKFCWNII